MMKGQGKTMGEAAAAWKTLDPAAQQQYKDMGASGGTTTGTQPAATAAPASKRSSGNSKSSRSSNSVSGTGISASASAGSSAAPNAYRLYVSEAMKVDGKTMAQAASSWKALGPIAQQTYKDRAATVQRESVDA
jgi:hypothetical protein